MNATDNGYTGIDNLEVMAEAQNYNAYLAGLIARHIREGIRVLDFGAGAGTFALPASRAGRNLICLEPDPQLQQHLGGLGLSHVGKTGDLEPGSFDAVYSFNVLEHIADDRAALVDLNDLLVDGGTLLLYVPAFQVLFSSMDEKVGHHRRYRRRGLTEIVGQAGFEVLSARYVDSLGFFAALLYRLLDRGAGDINRRALVIYDRYVFPLSRALDRLTGRLFGKNLLLIARKPPTS